MTKKINILLFLIILPNILGFIYDKMFRFSGNWFEDYQNYFKVGFVVISVLGSILLVLDSKKNKNYIWLSAGIVLLIILSIYLYFGISIINSSFGSF